MPVKAPEKVPDGSGPYVVAFSIPFRLNINPVKPEGVLINHAVNAVVAAPSDSATRIGSRTAEPHAEQQIDNQALKKVRRSGADAVE